MEPLAIVGISFKMPGKAVNEDGLWDIMETRKNVMTEWPESRSTVGSFHDGGSKKQNTVRQEDLSFFQLASNVRCRFLGVVLTLSTKTHGPLMPLSSQSPVKKLSPWILSNA